MFNPIDGKFINPNTVRISTRYFVQPKFLLIRNPIATKKQRLNIPISISSVDNGDG